MYQTLSSQRNWLAKKVDELEAQLARTKSELVKVEAHFTPDAAASHVERLTNQARSLGAGRAEEIEAALAAEPAVAEARRLSPARAALVAVPLLPKFLLSDSV